MSGRPERLRFQQYPDGSREVVQAGISDKSETVACHKAQQARCPHCKEFIGNLRHHVVRGSINGDGYYHVACAKAF